MSVINRRDFIRIATLAGASIGFPQLALANNPKVVIVGGGVGGCTAAKYIRKLDPKIEVTLIETKKVYQSCFMSNEVLSGDRTLASITFDYEGLKRHGVKIVIDRVSAIEADKKQVVTEGGEKFSYDACVVSPGVDFKWDAIEGYDAEVAEEIPHAWFAGYAPANDPAIDPSDTKGMGTYAQCTRDKCDEQDLAALGTRRKQGDVPPVIPVINLIATVRFIIKDSFAINLTGGFQTGFYFGGSLGYFFGGGGK